MTTLRDANEQLAFLRLVVNRVEDASIPYFITGSIALAVYATPRMTRDIDVVVDCDERGAAALATAFVVDSYASPEAAREAVRTTGMFNVIHNESLLKADFIIRKRDALTDEQFTRRRSIDLGGFSASVISPEDLILAKLSWSREMHSARQLEDVRAIIAAAPHLDWRYLSTWSVRIGVDEVLDQMK